MGGEAPGYCLAGQFPAIQSGAARAAQRDSNSRENERYQIIQTSFRLMDLGFLLVLGPRDGARTRNQRPITLTSTTAPSTMTTGPAHASLPT